MRHFLKRADRILSSEKFVQFEYQDPDCLCDEVLDRRGALRPLAGSEIPGGDLLWRLPAARRRSIVIKPHHQVMEPGIVMATLGNLLDQRRRHFGTVGPSPHILAVLLNAGKSV